MVLIGLDAPDGGGVVGKHHILIGLVLEEFTCCGTCQREPESVTAVIGIDMVIEAIELLYFPPEL